MITVEDAKKLLDEAASEHGDMRGVRKLRDAAPDLARALLDARAKLAQARADTEALSDPNAVHINMLRGTIAKPTIEQIIHLYGVDALCRALVPPIVREAGNEPA